MKTESQKLIDELCQLRERQNVEVLKTPCPDFSAFDDLVAACRFALECCQSLPGKSNHPLAAMCRAALKKAKQ